VFDYEVSQFGLGGYDSSRVNTIYDTGWYGDVVDNI
jgi:hypothetical protein